MFYNELKVKVTIIHPNGRWCMTQGPASPGPGRDEHPARRSRQPDDPLQDEAAGWRPIPSGGDLMDDAGKWEARLAAVESQGEPDESELFPERYLQLYADPGEPPPPGEDDVSAELIAQCREISAEEARAAAHITRLGQTGAMAAIAAALGRRGPGQPGSADRFPGEYPGPAAGFATGHPLDVAPGCTALALFAEDAAGDDDAYAGATDDELVGVICALDRSEASLAARKHAAVAELIRRRPAPGAAVQGRARMPEGWDEFAGDELRQALAETGAAAEAMLDLAWHLEVNLPGTKAAFRSGVLRQAKVAIIARATALLDPAEARAAEAMVLGRAGKLTPGGLRAAIAWAVMEIAPEKARKRREEEARKTRVERWAEDSGNAGLAGRELPPAEVMAADQLPCGDLAALRGPRCVVLCAVSGVNVSGPRRDGRRGLLGWCRDRWLAVRGPLSRGVPDGGDHELQVPVVQAGQGVAQADGKAGGDAGGELEDPAFAAAQG